MAFFRKRRNAKGEWRYYWRATVQIKLDDGTITEREIERGTGCATLADARQKAKIFEQEYHDARNRAPDPTPVREFLFADAVRTYVESGGDPRFLGKILDGIGTKPVSQIDQDTINGLARQIYPDCAASTINRQLFTPLLAVLNLPANQRRCTPPILTRPKGHDKKVELSLPDEAWFDAVLPELSARTRAVVLLLTLHGRRISDAIARRPEDLDPVHWILSVPDTKTGEPLQIRLADPVIEAMKEMLAEQRRRVERRLAAGKSADPSPWLFGTNSRSNISRDIREAAARAGVPYYSTHKLGRHSFATRLLREGKSLKFVKDAGVWKTIKMVADRYGHLEKSEVNEEVNAIASRWGNRRVSKKVSRLKVVK